MSDFYEVPSWWSWGPTADLEAMKTELLVRAEEAEARIEAALAIAHESPGPCVDWGERLDRVVEALTGGREK